MGRHLFFIVGAASVLAVSSAAADECEAALVAARAVALDRTLECSEVGNTIDPIVGVLIPTDARRFKIIVHRWQLLEHGGFQGREVGDGDLNGAEDTARWVGRDFTFEFLRQVGPVFYANLTTTATGEVTSLECR